MPFQVERISVEKQADNPVEEEVHRDEREHDEAEVGVCGLVPRSYARFGQRLFRLFFGSDKADHVRAGLGGWDHTDNSDGVSQRILKHVDTWLPERIGESMHGNVLLDHAGQFFEWAVIKVFVRVVDSVFEVSREFLLFPTHVNIKEDCVALLDTSHRVV